MKTGEISGRFIEETQIELHRQNPSGIVRNLNGTHTDYTPRIVAFFTKNSHTGCIQYGMRTLVPGQSRITS